MTGYQSKKAAAQDKLIDYDALSQKQLASIKRDMRISLEDAAVRAIHKVMAELETEQEPVQEFGLTRERFNALEVEITSLQSDWQSALKEIERLKAAQPAQEPWRESASDYERGVIDGRQKQAQSSVDKAVNRMAQRPWVGLTDEEIEHGCKESWVTEQAFQSAVWWAEARLKEKNNG